MPAQEIESGGAALRHTVSPGMPLLVDLARLGHISSVTDCLEMTRLVLVIRCRGHILVVYSSSPDS